MKLEIKKINGKWLVNNKPYQELDIMERHFMDEFFREVKLIELTENL